MNKSIRKFYEHKRRFDYGEACESSNGKQKRFIKKRSHKRARKQEILLRIEG